VRKSSRVRPSVVASYLSPPTSRTRQGRIWYLYVSGGTVSPRWAGWTDGPFRVPRSCVRGPPQPPERDRCLADYLAVRLGHGPLALAKLLRRLARKRLTYLRGGRGFVRRDDDLLGRVSESLWIEHTGFERTGFERTGFSPGDGGGVLDSIESLPSRSGVVLHNVVAVRTT